MLICVGPGLLTLWLVGERPAVLAVLAVSVLAVIAFAHWESSRQR